MKSIKDSVSVSLLLVVILLSSVNIVFYSNFNNDIVLISESLNEDHSITINNENFIYEGADFLGDLPAIDISGNPEERGRTQGSLLKDSIQDNIENYWIRVNEAGSSREEIMEIVKIREGDLQLDDPEMIIEIKSMAQAADVPYDDLLAFNLYTDINYKDKEQDHGCTAWIAHGTASKNGNTLFHKNRDLDRETQIIVNVAPSGGKNGYKALVSSGSTGVSIGFNDKGLAVGNTYCDTTDIDIFSSKGSLTAQREMLEECNSVDDVFTYLDDVFANEDMNQGSNLFVVDATSAAIIEHTGLRRCTKEEAIITNGVGYRSNYYIVLESRDSGTLTSARLTRYEDARDFLEERKGTLTAQDFNELSRYHRMLDEELPSEHNGVDGSISNYHTLCGATFEIDQEYPEVLSVMWAAIGTPDTAMYTPIHIGATNVNSRFTNSDAWDVAESILVKQNNKIFPFGSLTPYYLSLESEMMVEREIIRDEAYNYLEISQTSRALDTLTEFDNNSGDFVFNTMNCIDQSELWYDGFHYKNAIQTTSDTNWMKEEEKFIFDETISSERIVSYDFNTVIQSNTTFNLYQDDIDTYPYLFDAANRNSHTEATTTNYQSVWASDDTRWQTTDPGDSDEAFIWIEMKINEDPSEIEEIHFTFEGYSAESSDGEQAEFNMYLLRNGGDWKNDSCWYRIGSRLEILKGTDKTMTRTLRSNFEDFISTEGSLTWMVGTPYGHSDEIYCDYVKIDVIKSPSGSRVYDTSGNLQSILIDYGINWDSYLFKANHTLSSQANIIYSIQNSVGSTLCYITAEQATQGYAMKNLGTQTIRLFAALSSSDSSQTPLLNYWTIQKDTEGPSINIENPTTNQLFNHTAPSFNVTFRDPNNVSKMWYTLDEGISKYFFTTNTTFNQEAWNSLINGSHTITFYANDTLGNIASKTVDILVDILAPIITINSPEEFDTFGHIPPVFDLTITDSNLHSSWYRLWNGSILTENRTFSYGIDDSIKQSDWDQIGNGTVILSFYTNDSLGNWDGVNITIIKEIFFPVITINRPIHEKFFNVTVPVYQVSLSGSNLDKLWYRLENASIITDNSTLRDVSAGEGIYSGDIDQSLWNQIGNGEVVVRFYLNTTGGNLCIDSVTIQKDIEIPTILINNPTENRLFNNTVPHFNVIITESNVDTMWYSFDGGANKYYFTSNTSFNEEAWNTLGNGTHTITFYARDKASNIGYDTISIQLDKQAPIMQIKEPGLNDPFYDESPKYNITITDSNLNYTWYTINEGETKYFIMSLTGDINQTIWAELAIGMIMITFYANDTVGNLASKSVTVEKLNAPTENPPLDDDDDDDNDKAIKKYEMLNEQLVLAIIIGSSLSVLGIGTIMFIRHRKRSSAVKYLLKDFSVDDAKTDLPAEKENDSVVKDLDLDFDFDED